MTVDVDGSGSRFSFAGTETSIIWICTEVVVIVVVASEL